MCNHCRLSGCILGTTSNYFASALEKFPNLLQIHGDKPSTLFTRERKPRLRCDHSFLQSLTHSNNKNNDLRRYFQDLTSSLLYPFETMFRPLPFMHRESPSSQIFNPYLDQPKLPRFNSELFLNSLSKEALAPMRRYLPSKKKIIALNKLLMDGPNFSTLV